jgi:ATP-binding protein involved in chromosome partitioning
MSSDEQIIAALKTVKYPGFSRDIVSFGLVKGISVQEGVPTIELAVTSADPTVPRQIQADAELAVRALPGLSTARVRMAASEPVTLAGQAQAQGVGAATHSANRIEGVKHIIAVGSGKGGVGKSTVAANLALALHAEGYKVGLCDCDLYGPSIALMFGTTDAPLATEDNRIIPVERFGLQLMSMGFLLEGDAPAVLRGPMVTRYTKQFLRNVAWHDLDYLILDLPPGTGDIQLTIVQTVALSGAVIVTTPQEVALIDARKAASMFGKVNVRVLGILENMSYFLCPDNGKRYDIFGSGGGKREAARLQVPFLGEIPIEVAVREAGDHGEPIVRSAPNSASALAFRETARQLTRTVSSV